MKYLPVHACTYKETGLKSFVNICIYFHPVKRPQARKNVGNEPNILFSKFNLPPSIIFVQPLQLSKHHIIFDFYSLCKHHHCRGLNNCSSIFNDNVWMKSTSVLFWLRTDSTNKLIFQFWPDPKGAEFQKGERTVKQAIS